MLFQQSTAPWESGVSQCYVWPPHRLRNSLNHFEAVYAGPLSVLICSGTPKVIVVTSFHRIIDSLRLETIFNIIEYNLWPNTITSTKPKHYVAHLVISWTGAGMVTPFPWAACSNIQSPFQWRNSSLILPSKNLSWHSLSAFPLVLPLVAREVFDPDMASSSF